MVEWITADDVVGALSRPDLAADGWVAQCVEAANDWAFRRRLAYGYVDVEEDAPNAAVKLGTVQLAVSMVQAQGAIESPASFAEFAAAGGGSMFGTFGEIKRMLGIPRPLAG